MAGGNLAAGSLMVLSVIIITAFVAFMVSDTNPSGDAIGCDSDGNTTTCEGGSPSSFLSTFFDVAVTGFSGNVVIDGFYVLIMAGVLVVGFALIVAGIIGTIAGGG